MPATMAAPISAAMRAAPPAWVLFVGVDMKTKSPDDMSDISSRQERNRRRLKLLGGSADEHSSSSYDPGWRARRSLRAPGRARRPCPERRQALQRRDHQCLV